MPCGSHRFETGKSIYIRHPQDEIASAKWLTWHGKSNEAVERLKSLHNMFDLPPADPAHQPLWWNLRGTYWYLDSKS